MSEQHTDPLPYVVIDGPRAGETIACELDSFDVLIGDPLHGTESRITYYLRPDGDTQVWRCGMADVAENS